MAVKVLPYKMGSKSAKDLARGLGAKRILLSEESKYGKRRNDFIINWGNSGLRAQDIFDNYGYSRFVNEPSAISIAHSKMDTYTHLQGRMGVTIPEFTTERGIAEDLLTSGAVLARTLMSANSGRGITVVETGGNLPQAPLYVAYVKKRDEFRVHVAFGQCIDIQQKKAREGVESDYKIRSYDNGWVFCREGIVCPDQVVQMARTAVDALGLDFGAVDIGWNAHHEEATIYEVNTAPGMEGQTLTSYVDAFRDAANG